MVIDFFNREVLRWGIQRAGYQVDDFLQSNTRVKDWMEGIKNPTINQLKNIANKLYLPFGYLFLETPPREELNFPFFRSLKEDSGELSINVYDSIKIIERRQDWLRDFLLENNFEPLNFVGKYNINSNIYDIVEDIRETLEIDKLWASKFNDWASSINFLSENIEKKGIILSFSGVVGSNNRRKIPIEECRGFVLVDKVAPFMFVNNNDTKSAQVFTIIHELAHIWLGQSAGFDFRNMEPADVPVEKFCDQIATEFLTPEEIFIVKWEEQNNKEITETIYSLNKLFKVSPIVIGRRAMDLGLIPKKTFFKFYNKYVQDIKLAENPKSAGGNFYGAARRKISPTFASYINMGVRSGKLLYRDAYRLTGLKGTTFDTFINKL